MKAPNQFCNEGQFRQYHDAASIRRAVEDAIAQSKGASSQDENIVDGSERCAPCAPKRRHSNRHHACSET